MAPKLSHGWARHPALPELGFATCSHELFPPFLAANSFGTLLQMQPNLCSLLTSTITFGRSLWWGHVDHSLGGNRTKDVFGRGPTPHGPPLFTARFAHGHYSPFLRQLPGRDSREMASQSAPGSGRQLRTKLRAGSGWEKDRFIKFEPLTHNYLPDTCSALCAGEAVFFLSWRAPHEDAEDADPASDHLQVKHHLLL